MLNRNLNYCRIISFTEIQGYPQNADNGKKVLVAISNNRFP